MSKAFGELSKPFNNLFPACPELLLDNPNIYPVPTPRRSIMQVFRCSANWTHLCDNDAWPCCIYPHTDRHQQRAVIFVQRVRLCWPWRLHYSGSCPSQQPPWMWSWLSSTTDRSDRHIQPLWESSVPPAHFCWRPRPVQCSYMALLSWMPGKMIAFNYLDYCHATQSRSLILVISLTVR